MPLEPRITMEELLETTLTHIDETIDQALLIGKKNLENYRLRKEISNKELKRVLAYMELRNLDRSKINRSDISYYNELLEWCVGLAIRPLDESERNMPYLN